LQITVTTDSGGEVSANQSGDAISMSVVDPASTTDAAGGASKVDSCPGDVGRTSDAADLRAVLEQISPMPKSKTVWQRKRTAECAEVLTGSPFKVKLLEKQTLKKKKVAASSKTTANKETSKTAAKPGNKKLTCRMDKGRKPSQFPSAVAATKKAVGQPCSVCGILENSKEDIAFAQDWIVDWIWYFVCSQLCCIIFRPISLVTFAILKKIIPCVTVEVKRPPLGHFGIG